MTTQKGYTYTIIIGFIFLITVLMLTAAFVVKDNEEGNDAAVTVAETPECTYTSNSCPEGYYCYHAVSGGLRWDGTAPVETVGGDQKCHKLCESDSDCESGEICEIDQWIQIEDYGETVSFCVADPNGNINGNTNSATNANADSTTVDTSDWLTYENEEYAYRISYPPTYNIIDQDNATISIAPIDGSYPYPYISVDQTPIDEKISDVVDTLLTKKKIYASGIPGWSVTESMAIGGEALNYLFELKGHTYLLRGNNSEINKMIFKTFQFTEVWE